MGKLGCDLGAPPEMTLWPYLPALAQVKRDEPLAVFGDTSDSAGGQVEAAEQFQSLQAVEGMVATC